MPEKWVNEFDPKNPPRMWSMGHFVLDRDVMEYNVDRKLTDEEWLEFVFVTEKGMEQIFKEFQEAFASHIVGEFVKMEDTVAYKDSSLPVDIQEAVEKGRKRRDSIRRNRGKAL